MPYQTEGETISKPTGQIDIKPTILNLLGIDTTNDIRFSMICFQMNILALLFYVMVASLQISMHTKQHFLRPYNR